MTSLGRQTSPSQLEIFNEPHRSKSLQPVEGLGKSSSRLVASHQGFTEPRPKQVHLYVALTFQQAKDILWGLLKEIGHEVIASAYENTAVLTLINGSKIALKGSDRPDTLRGVGLAYCVIDEYADMKPSVFEQILRPAMADVKGDCLFIGTPKGRNHFYEIYNYAEEEKDPEWCSFHFTSFDNPFLDPNEIEAARNPMSSFAFRQEFQANFEGGCSEVFKEEWLKYEEKSQKKATTTWQWTWQALKTLLARLHRRKSD